MQTRGVPGAIQEKFFKSFKVTLMGLCHFRPAEELTPEIPTIRVAGSNFASDKCYGDVLHKPNRRGAEKRWSSESKAKYCLHLNMVCEEESVAGTARGQFKGTPSNSSCIGHISTSLRREAAQIQYKNNVIWNQTSRHLQRATQFF